MKKELSDYLPFYFGCEIIGTYLDEPGRKGYLTGITNGGTECEIQFILDDEFNVEEEPYFNEIKDVKPILRRLSDLTDEELKELRSERGHMKGVHREDLGYIIFHNSWSPEDFRFLISKQFDLFGLIEEGLAIDKTTLNLK